MFQQTNVSTVYILHRIYYFLQKQNNFKSNLQSANWMYSTWLQFHSSRYPLDVGSFSYFVVSLNLETYKKVGFVFLLFIKIHEQYVPL